MDTAERQCTHLGPIAFLQQNVHGGGGLVSKSCLTLVTPWTVALQAPLSKFAYFYLVIPASRELYMQTKFYVS